MILKFTSRVLLAIGTAVSACLAAGSAPVSGVAPHDLQWWRDARFGMFIHWGPAAIGGDGNLLFNVGPRADGKIEPYQVTRLSLKAENRTSIREWQMF